MAEKDKDILENIGEQEYKYGFTSDIETETIDKGLSEDVVRLISAKKGEPAVDDRAARGGLPPLADDGTADVGPPDDSRNRFSGHHLLRRPQAAEKTRFDGRSRSRTQTDLRQTGHSPRRADGAGGRGGRCRDGLGVGQDHLQGGAGREGHHFLFDFRSAARLPGSREEVSRQRRALYRQFLRRAQRRGLFRRFVLLHSEGRPLSDGALRPISASTPRGRGSSNVR